MSIILEVLKELFSMFMADMRLSLSTLALVLIVAFLIKVMMINPLIAGGILLAGCVMIVIMAAYSKRNS